MASSHSSYSNNYMNQEFIPMSTGYLGPMGIDPMHHHGMSAAPDQYQHSFSQQPAYLATTMTLSQFEALHQQSQTTSQARMGTPQRIFLENEFMKNPKPSTEEKSRYAQMFGLPIAKINNWFQNRRASQKRSDKESEANEMASCKQETETQSPSMDDTPSLSEDNGGTESNFSSARNTVSPELESTVPESHSFSSLPSSQGVSPTSAEPTGPMTLNAPSKGMTNSSRPRKRPTALNLAHNNRTPSFAMHSPSSLPTSPGLRPGSDARRRTSTPGITPHAIQKSRTFSHAPRSPRVMPEFANQLATQLSLPTGLTAIKTQFPPTSLPTPPLATDASVTSLRSGPGFPFSHAPDTPITPATTQFPSQLYEMTQTPGVDTPEFNRFFGMRRPELSPLPSSAATHFNLDTHTPPQSAPPTQSSFVEHDLYQPFPRPPPRRNASTIYLTTSPLQEERELPETGDISFPVPYTNHDSRTPTMQYPTPAVSMNFDYNSFHGMQELKKESSPYEESLFSEMDSGVTVLHGVGMDSHLENVTPVPVHDAAPGYDNLAMTASAGFNNTRSSVWRG